jgi:hypothetical protein
VLGGGWGDFVGNITCGLVVDGSGGLAEQREKEILRDGTKVLVSLATSPAIGLGGDMCCSGVASRLLVVGGVGHMFCASCGWLGAG